MVSFIPPLLLDLYCCQGAASRGYELAGFDVLGGDLYAQPRYPYPFFRMDALAALRALIANRGMVTMPSGHRRKVRAIHTAPPCQGRTNAQKIQGNAHPMLIGPTRELLIETGLPYVIENVPLMAGVPDVDPMKDPIMLCGAMFPPLRTYRHRLFESNVPLTAPRHAEHPEQQIKMGRPLREGDWYQAVGNFSGVDYARRNMGVPWMNRDGIRECTPPAYTEHLGRQLLAHLAGSC